jgi:hypothetical protein
LVDWQSKNTISLIIGAFMPVLVFLPMCIIGLLWERFWTIAVEKRIS